MGLIKCLCICPPPPTVWNLPSVSVLNRLSKPAVRSGMPSRGGLQCQMHALMSLPRNDPNPLYVKPTNDWYDPTNTQRWHYLPCGPSGTYIPRGMFVGSFCCTCLTLGPKNTMYHVQLTGGIVDLGKRTCYRSENREDANSARTLGLSYT